MVRCWTRTLLAFIAVVSTAAWSPRPPIYQIDAADGTTHKSLYPQNGAVEALVGQEGLSLVEKDPSIIWVVEYYDDNCPHCWYFSAIYPFVAKALKSQKVRFAAFNCEDIANQVACQKAKVMMVPTVLAYNVKAPGSIHRVHVHNNGDIDDPLPAKAIAETLSIHAAGKMPIWHPEVFRDGSGLSSGSATLVKPSGPPGKSGWPNEPYGSVQTRFHDAHIGMARLLRDGYTSSAKYQAALETVDFCSRVFGKDEAKVFASLKGQLAAKVNLEPVEFKAIMQAWESQFDSTWAFCKTPAKTCGVWQLLHGISALIAIKYTSITPSEALPKYRFMVDNFFDCEVCRQHFVRSYDECLFGRCEVLQGDDEAQRKALVLWVWRTHNAVSVRVISEHPPVGESVDRRWPAYKDCPGCWDVAVVNGGTAKEMIFKKQANDDQPVFDVFNENSVYGFMLFTYLGEDHPSRNYIMPSSLHQLTVAWSPHVVMLTQLGAFAALSMVVLVAQRLSKRRSAEVFEEELLEAPEILLAE